MPGAGIVPTTNGMENGGGTNGNDDDPSKKRKPSTFAVVAANSIWLIRTAHGHFWHALVHAIVDGTRIIRKTIALVMNGVAFAYSAGVELLLTSHNEYKNQWLPLVEELHLFLQTSGIADELERGLANYRFLSNVALLARIQDTILEKQWTAGKSPHLDRRLMALSLPDTTTITAGKDKKLLSEQEKGLIMDDGRRFMNYTTAAYGIGMIDAAEIAVHGSIQTSKAKPSTTATEAGTKLLSSLKSSMTVSQQTKQMQHSSSFYNEDWLLDRISEHIKIPEKDIYLMNLPDDQVETLRFFIAVDHINKAVVLSIRGSLTVKEILIDIAGFSSPFCGGEAHSEMANNAEKVWDEAKDLILNLLCQNADYELILTGHSLGGGAACLLNILLHENNREKVDGRAIRCFAYASPPVFAGKISNDAKEACINYIHDSDVVPFLSVDSVRRTFAALYAVEESNLSVWIRTLALWGYTEVINSPTLIRVESALRDPLPVKEGAPELLIPAHVNVWMRSVAPELPKEISSMQALRQLHSLLPFDFVLVDSEKLARMGVSFDPAMVTDHFPNAYEGALHNLKE